MAPRWAQGLPGSMKQGGEDQRGPAEEGIDSELGVNQSHLETCCHNPDARVHHTDPGLMSLKRGPGICVFNRPSGDFKKPPVF